MIASSHIRRIAVIAVIGCAILAGSSNAAAARPIDDLNAQTARTAASTAEPRASSTGEGSDWTLPIALAAAVVLVAVGTAGYAHRARTSRRAIA
jgi:hypothetical protein